MNSAPTRQITTHSSLSPIILMSALSGGRMTLRGVDFYFDFCYAERGELLAKNKK